MGKARLYMSIGLLVAGLGAGMSASGWLTLRFLGLQAQPATAMTYVHYLRAIRHPSVAPHARLIKLAGVAGFGMPMFAAMGGIALLLRKPRRSLHGAARFASRADLARHAMLDPSPTGIVVGQWGRRIIRLPGQQFALLAAPTRSGKGVGVVIPNLLDYRQSIVVLDIKEENFKLTSGWRAAQGQAVFAFNPFAEDRRTHRWNPLSYVSADPAFRVSDLMAIAAMLYPDTVAEQAFWTSQARNAFLAFALYLFDNHDDAVASGFPAHPPQPTLGAIHRLCTGSGGPAKATFQGLSQRGFLQQPARTAFGNLLSQADDTFASIMGTLHAPLNAWINPVLDAATSADDFLLTDLRRRAMTVYVGIQPGKLAESRTIVNLFFSQVINVNTRALPQDDPGLTHQCLLLMDEFTSIGKVDILASAVGYLAGYNIRLLPVIQSMAQLDATYGPEVARTIIGNHALQIVFAPREQRDANDYSEMLGFTTVRRQNVTRGRETSRSEVHERRALMLPQELKAMGNDRQLLLYEGIAHPVQCGKIRYYEHRLFRDRILPQVEVPAVAVRA